MAEKLKEFGITGLRPGQTKELRISTYGLTMTQLEYVYRTFAKLLKEEGYGI